MPRGSEAKVAFIGLTYKITQRAVDGFLQIKMH